MAASTITPKLCQIRSAFINSSKQFALLGPTCAQSVFPLRLPAPGLAGYSPRLEAAPSPPAHPDLRLGTFKYQLRVSPPPRGIFENTGNSNLFPWPGSKTLAPGQALASSNLLLPVSKAAGYLPRGQLCSRATEDKGSWHPETRCEWHVLLRRKGRPRTRGVEAD